VWPVPPFTPSSWAIRRATAGRHSIWSGRRRGPTTRVNSGSSLGPRPNAQAVRPEGVWRLGGFLVAGVKDGRTIGYVIASGEELVREPVHLTALETVAVVGRVHDADGHPVEGVAVESDYYFLPVGRGPHPHALVNFWLSRPSADGDGRRARVTELTAVTGPDGSFSLRDVPAMPGGLMLRVTCPGRAELDLHYDPGSRCPPWRLGRGPPSRSLSGSQTVARLAGRWLVLEGRPDDAPNTCGIAGIPVGAVGFVNRTAETDDVGIVTFGELPPGSYRVSYLRGPSDTWALPVIDVGPARRGQCREIEAVAVEGSVLCGTVRSARTGTPLEHAWVRYEGASYPRTGSSLQTAVTDAQGRFATRTAPRPRPTRPPGLRGRRRQAGRIPPQPGHSADSSDGVGPHRSARFKRHA